MELICVAMGLGIIGAVIFFWNNSRIDEAWTNAASRLRLQFSKDGLLSREISGDRAGFFIRVTTSKEGVGKEAFTVTSYHLGFRKPLGLELYLNRQIPRTGFARIDHGGIDIVVGDPIFDPKVIVNGSDENQVREFLDPETRNLLLGLFKKYDEFELTPGGIHLAKKGVEANANFLERNVKHLVEVADKICDFEAKKNDPEEEVTPPPLPKREITPDTVIELKPASIEDAEISEAEIEEAVEPDEAVVSNWDMPEASVSEAIVPREVEIEGIETITDPATEITEPVEPSEPEKESDEKVEAEVETVEAPETDGGEFQALCEELFVSGLSRFEAGRTFDSKFKGTSVGGVGTVRRVDKFSSDLVFGRGPGLCIQYEVMKSEKGDAIMAFVERPAEDYETLREEIGETISFRGELLKCDPFTNRLYLGQSK